MMSKRSKSFTIGGAVVIALLFASFFFKFSAVTVEADNQTYWTWQDTFGLAWIHSVEKEEWVEFYELKNDQLLLTHTSFKTFGAGVPSTPNDGENTVLENGYVTMDINRMFQSLQLVVSENVQSTLVLEEKEIPLYKLTKNYEVVTISVTKLSLWDMVFKGVKL